MNELLKMYGDLLATLSAEMAFLYVLLRIRSVAN